MDKRKKFLWSISIIIVLEFVALAVIVGIRGRNPQEEALNPALATNGALKQAPTARKPALEFVHADSFSDGKLDAVNLDVYLSSINRTYNLLRKNRGSCKAEVLPKSETCTPEKDFGFSSGSLCLYLRISNAHRFHPAEKSEFTHDYYSVVCVAKVHEKNEAVVSHPMDVFPSEGFKREEYPTVKQRGDADICSPMVITRLDLEKLDSSTRINIECKASIEEDSNSGSNKAELDLETKDILDMIEEMDAESVTITSDPDVSTATQIPVIDEVLGELLKKLQASIEEKRQYPDDLERDDKFLAGLLQTKEHLSNSKATTVASEFAPTRVQLMKLERGIKEYERLRRDPSTDDSKKNIETIQQAIADYLKNIRDKHIKLKKALDDLSNETERAQSTSQKTKSILRRLNYFAKKILGQKDDRSMEQVLDRDLGNFWQVIDLYEASDREDLEEVNEATNHTRSSLNNYIQKKIEEKRNLLFDMVNDKKTDTNIKKKIRKVITIVAKIKDILNGSMPVNNEDLSKMLDAYETAMDELIANGGQSFASGGPGVVRVEDLTEELIEQKLKFSQLIAPFVKQKRVVLKPLDDTLEDILEEIADQLTLERRPKKKRVLRQIHTIFAHLKKSSNSSAYNEDIENKLNQILEEISKISEKTEDEIDEMVRQTYEVSDNLVPRDQIHSVQEISKLANMICDQLSEPRCKITNEEQALALLKKLPENSELLDDEEFLEELEDLTDLLEESEALTENEDSALEDVYELIKNKRKKIKRKKNVQIILELNKKDKKAYPLTDEFRQNLDVLQLDSSKRNDSDLEDKFSEENELLEHLNDEEDLAVLLTSIQEAEDMQIEAERLRQLRENEDKFKGYLSLLDALLQPDVSLASLQKNMTELTEAIPTLDTEKKDILMKKIGEFNDEIEMNEITPYFVEEFADTISSMLGLGENRRSKVVKGISDAANVSSEDDFFQQQTLHYNGTIKEGMPDGPMKILSAIKPVNISKEEDDETTTKQARDRTDKTMNANEHHSSEHGEEQNQTTEHTGDGVFLPSTTEDSRSDSRKNESETRGEATGSASKATANTVIDEPAVTLETNKEDKKHIDRGKLIHILKKTRPSITDEQLTEKVETLITTSSQNVTEEQAEQQLSDAIDILLTQMESNQDTIRQISKFQKELRRTAGEHDLSEKLLNLTNEIETNVLLVITDKSTENYKKLSDVQDSLMDKVYSDLTDVENLKEIVGRIADAQFIATDIPEVPRAIQKTLENTKEDFYQTVKETEKLKRIREFIQNSGRQGSPQAKDDVLETLKDYSDEVTTKNKQIVDPVLEAIDEVGKTLSREKKTSMLKVLLEEFRSGNTTKDQEDELSIRHFRLSDGLSNTHLRRLEKAVKDKTPDTSKNLTSTILTIIQQLEKQNVYDALGNSKYEGIEEKDSQVKYEPTSDISEFFNSIVEDPDNVLNEEKYKKIKDKLTHYSAKSENTSLDKVHSLLSYPDNMLYLYPILQKLELAKENATCGTIDITPNHIQWYDNFIVTQGLSQSPFHHFMTLLKSFKELDSRQKEEVSALAIEIAVNYRISEMIQHNDKSLADVIKKAAACDPNGVNKALLEDIAMIQRTVTSNIFEEGRLEDALRDCSTATTHQIKGLTLLYLSEEDEVGKLREHLTSIIQKWLVALTVDPLLDKVMSVPISTYLAAKFDRGGFSLDNDEADQLRKVLRGFQVAVLSNGIIAHEKQSEVLATLEEIDTFIRASVQLSVVQNSVAKSLKDKSFSDGRKLSMLRLLYQKISEVQKLIQRTDILPINLRLKNYLLQIKSLLENDRACKAAESASSYNLPSIERSDEDTSYEKIVKEQLKADINKETVSLEELCKWLKQYSNCSEICKTIATAVENKRKPKMSGMAENESSEEEQDQAKDEDGNEENEEDSDSSAEQDSNDQSKTVTSNPTEAIVFFAGNLPRDNSTPPSTVSSSPVLLQTKEVKTAPTEQAPSTYDESKTATVPTMILVTEEVVAATTTSQATEIPAPLPHTTILEMNTTMSTNLSYSQGVPTAFSAPRDPINTTDRALGDGNTGDTKDQDGKFEYIDLHAEQESNRGSKIAVSATTTEATGISADKMPIETSTTQTTISTSLSPFAASKPANQASGTNGITEIATGPATAQLTNEVGVVTITSHATENSVPVTNMIVAETTTARSDTIPFLQVMSTNVSPSDKKSQTIDKALEENTGELKYRLEQLADILSASTPAASEVEESNNEPLEESEDRNHSSSFVQELQELYTNPATEAITSGLAGLLEEEVRHFMFGETQANNTAKQQSEPTGEEDKEYGTYGGLDELSGFTTKTTQFDDQSVTSVYGLSNLVLPFTSYSVDKSTSISVSTTSADGSFAETLQPGVGTTVETTVDKRNGTVTEDETLGNHGTLAEMGKKLLDLEETGSSNSGNGKKSRKRKKKKKSDGGDEEYKTDEDDEIQETNSIESESEEKASTTKADIQNVSVSRNKTPKKVKVLKVVVDSRENDGRARANTSTSQEHMDKTVEASKELVVSQGQQDSSSTIHYTTAFAGTGKKNKKKKKTRVSGEDYDETDEEEETADVTEQSAKGRTAKKKKRVKSGGGEEEYESDEYENVETDRTVNVSEHTGKGKKLKKKLKVGDPEEYETEDYETIEKMGANSSLLSISSGNKTSNTGDGSLDEYETVEDYATIHNGNIAGNTTQIGKKTRKKLQGSQMMEADEEYEIDEDSNGNPSPPTASKDSSGVTKTAEKNDTVTSTNDKSSSAIDNKSLVDQSNGTSKQTKKLSASADSNVPTESVADEEEDEYTDSFEIVTELVLIEKSEDGSTVRSSIMSLDYDRVKLRDDVVGITRHVETIIEEHVGGKKAKLGELRIQPNMSSLSKTSKDGSNGSDEFFSVEEDKSPQKKFVNPGSGKNVTFETSFTRKEGGTEQQSKGPKEIEKSSETHSHSSIISTGKTTAVSGGSKTFSQTITKTSSSSSSSGALGKTRLDEGPADPFEAFRQKTRNQQPLLSPIGGVVGKTHSKTKKAPETIFVEDSEYEYE